MDGMLAVSPRVMRQILERGLSVSPGSPVLLSCMLMVGASSRIATHTRAFFHSHCQPDKNLDTPCTTWLFAAHFEASQLRPADGGDGGSGLALAVVGHTSVSSTRLSNIFERALATGPPAVRASTALWLMYLEFCLEQHALAVAQADADSRADGDSTGDGMSGRRNGGASASARVRATGEAAKRVFMRAIRACPGA